MARRVCGAETIVLFLDANSVDLSHTTVKHALPNYIQKVVFTYNRTVDGTLLA